MLLIGGGEELSFDVERLRNVKVKIEKEAEDLTTERQKVMETLDILQKDWKTPAGVRFFESIDNDWVESVEKCEKTLATFVDVLDSVISIFDQVAEETELLKM